MLFCFVLFCIIYRWLFVGHHCGPDWNISTIILRIYIQVPMWHSPSGAYRKAQFALIGQFTQVWAGTNHLVSTSALLVFLQSLCSQPDAGEPGDVSQSTKHFWSFKSKHCWSRWPWDSKLFWKHNIYTHLLLPLQCGFSPAATIKISVWSLILKATLCTNWYFAWFVAPNQKTRNVFSVSCIVILPSHRSNIVLEQQIQGDPLTRHCTIKMMLKMLF